MANKTLTTRQKMVFRGKPGAPPATPPQPIARQTPKPPLNRHRAPKPTR